MLAVWIEGACALLAVGGIVYTTLALLGARSFVRDTRRRASQASSFTPPVTILKPVKGVDQRMYAAFASHATQQYAGEYEILFGVSSMDDPAVAEINRLVAEFPERSIRIIECPQRLGTSGKISNLVQMLPHAQHEHIIINDSDILVWPHYLTRVMRCFDNFNAAAKPVGMVTAPYIGNAGDRPGLWSRLEALGIATDFFPGVLTARLLEGGIHFGLGSTLAMTRTALAAAGGLEPLVESLADDYELGTRIAQAGYRVELTDEVVETSVPKYHFRNFADHQIRWARTMRDSRRWGYLGLGITYCVPWALATMIASGFALESVSLFALAALARVAVALSAGVGILRDGQVLRDLWLLPLRDFFGLIFWAWSYAGDTIVWRGERFHLRNGTLVHQKHL